MASSKEILDFIATFKGSEAVFTNGNCYWFAKILKERFPDGDILYNSTFNHFAFDINGKIHDITGIIPEHKDWYYWDFYKKEDPIHAMRIYRDCVLHISPSEWKKWLIENNIIEERI